MDSYLSNMMQGQGYAPVGGGYVKPGNSGNVHTMTNYIPEELLSELKAGDTFQGEIKAVNGQEVQLQLINGQYMTAKLEAQMQLALGQILNFEVQSNENARIVLKPLYTNLLQQQVGEAALRAAHLAVNDKNLNLVSQLIENGMSIDKNNLPKLYRQIAQNPNVPVANILQLNKLHIPVTANNLEQYAQYKNLEYKLTEGIRDTADEIVKLYDTLAGENAQNIQGSTAMQGAPAVQFMDHVLKFLLNEAPIQGEVQNSDSSTQTVNGQNVMEQAMTEIGNDASDKTAQIVNEQTTVENRGSLNEQTITVNQGDMAKQDGVQPNQPNVNYEQSLDTLKQNEQNNSQTVQEQQKASQSQNIQLNDKTIPAQEGGDRASITSPLPDRDTDAARLNQQLRLWLEAKPEEKEAIYSSKPFRKAISDALVNKWTLTPEDVGKEGKIEQFYRRLASQSDKLSQLMQESAGDNTVGTSAKNIKNNIEFMNDVNQTFQYVQLPLKMSGKEASGELYVYTNKRNLARKDGTITALLHLDMEHLGMMDINISLETMNDILTTRFCLEEDILSFMNSHMEELTSRLQKAGYSCKTYVEARRADKTVFDTMEEQLLGGASQLSYQAFDIKA